MSTARTQVLTSSIADSILIITFAKAYNVWRLAVKEEVLSLNAVTAGAGRSNPTYVPLHHRIYVTLTASLDTGEWKQGDRMPTEAELSAQFGVSLITVRRALDELVRESRIERTRGKGTFVSKQPVERDLTELTSFTDEMRNRGRDARTELLHASLAEASPRVASKLAIPAGSAVYSIERLRFVDDEPLLIELVQLPAHLAPGLLDEDLAGQSLYDILSDRHGIHLVRGEESLQPALPSAREAKLLLKDRRHPVLALELVSYTAEGKPVEYCRSIVRGDRARYHFEVNRQRATLTLVPPVKTLTPQEHT
jgi:GntR family transcriptional regulator